jgi:hypothetical protein
MKSKLTQIQIVALAGTLGIVALGFGGYYYLDGQLSATEEQIVQLNTERQKLLSRPYTPSAGNIKGLTGNNEVLQTALKQLNSRLRSPDSKQATVAQVNAIVFKQYLAEERRKLIALAATKNVALPANFYFGFSRYVNQNPEDRDTAFLGKQWLAINELAQLLCLSGVARIENVRRTFDEISGGESKEATVVGVEAGSEVLRGKAQVLSRGLYTVYPFEIEFLAKPAALRVFLGKLLYTPDIFVVRAIYVNSVMPSPRRLEDLAKEVGSSSEGSSPVTRPPVPAMGFEEIKVRLRIDLVDWSGEMTVPEVKPKPAAATKS